MDSKELASRIMARLTMDQSELPALVIDGARFDYSALATMTPDERRQWGEPMARYIDKFLQAAQDGMTRLVLYDSERSEVSVALLSQPEWYVLWITRSIPDPNRKVLLTTGMDMDAL